jgi:glycosyltransferase involved in cell wall biosynthesis
MIQSPFLSICIPTMNRRLELERTLARLLMRDQTSSFQIIVSDNYSADGTPEFLNQMESQEPRLQHIRQSSRVTFDQNVLACVSKATG